MTGGVHDAARRASVDNPADLDAYIECVRQMDDARMQFASLRRAVLLLDGIEGRDGLDIAGDVLRKALQASAAAGVGDLRRWVNSVPFQHRLIPPFVAASLLVTRRVDLDRIAAASLAFGACDDNFARILSVLTRNPAPAVVQDAYEVGVTKLHIGVVLRLAGHLRLAARVERDASAYMRLVRRSVYGTQSRVLTDSWVFAIGHMVELAFLLKAQSAGLVDYRRVKVWKGSAANSALWRRIRALSPDMEVVERWESFAESYSSSLLEWVDGRYADRFEVYGIIADRAGDARGAIMERPSRSEPILARYLDDVGIGRDEKFVTLHCRERGYRARAAERSDLRNSDIANSLPALRALVERGYRVVRLGDRTMTPLPSMAGVVDYALSPAKSAELDVLLPATADFHVGSSSGLSLVPLLFGTPCLFLNWYTLDLLPWGRQNWTVPKPMLATADHRRVLDWDVCRTFGQIRERRLLRDFGYEVQDLTSAEIERAVLDFAAVFETALPPPPKTGRNASRILVADGEGGFREVS